MPTQQPKAAIAAIEDPLLKVYAKAWQDILDLQEQIAADPAKWRRRRRLAELQQAVEDKMAELDSATRQWASSELVRPYALGAAAGATELGQSAAAVWTMLPEDAISRIASDTLNDLLKSTRYVRRTTKTLVRAVAKDEILAKLIRGDTAVQAGRRVRQILEQKGIHAIRYKDGSRHGLKEYSEMLVRTKTAEAYNLGAIEAQENLGVTFWECFDGYGCGLTSHQDPVKALGRVVDKETALRYPVSHPNCRRAYGARPDIATKGEADAATPTVAPSQIAANRQADQQRTRTQVARRYRQRQKTAPNPASRAAVRRTQQRASLAAAKRGDAEVPTTRRQR